MKKVLLASTAVAAVIAFSSSAVAQDPGRADFGATEGGGGAGSAFTLKTNGAVKFYLKYAGPVAEEGKVEKGGSDFRLSGESNDGFFTLVNAELEFNGAATTDDGIDISTHIDFGFSGGDNEVDIGSSDNPIFIGRNARIDELSLKISGGFGSVEMGRNDGAEDILKTYGGSVAAGTGGINGDLHEVKWNDGRVIIPGGIGGGGQAGGGDSSDALKVTYLTPVFAGVQLGASLAYETLGPKDANGGVLGYGFGAKYSGEGGGVSYAVSLLYGDTVVAVDGGTALPALLPVPTNPGASGSYEARQTYAADLAEFRAALTARDNAKAARANAQANGSIGIGGKFSISGFSAAAGITINNLGVNDSVTDLAEDDGGGTPSSLAFSAGVAYAIPETGANVSLTGGATDLLNLDTSPATETALADYSATGFQVVASADYAVLPGVTLATDLGYGDGNTGDEIAGGISWLLRVTAAF